MNKEREALKLALEALGKAKRQIVNANVAPHGCISDAIAAIEEALAQPEQEPVATKTEKGITLHVGWDDLPSSTKLYTSPPRPDLTDADRKTYQAGHNAGVAHHKQATKREWVGLSAKDVDEITDDAISIVDAMLLTEETLKDRNK